MAPIGSVIKNGLLYVILIIPIIYIGSYLIAVGFSDLLYANFNKDGTITDRAKAHPEYFGTAVLELTMGLSLIIGLGGLVFMKSLSDVVEDGMVEF